MSVLQVRGDVFLLLAVVIKLYSGKWSMTEEGFFIMAKRVEELALYLPIVVLRMDGAIHPTTHML